MIVFFTKGHTPVEEANCDAVDAVLEHITIRIRNSGVQVFDHELKEVLYDRDDKKEE